MTTISRPVKAWRRSALSSLMALTLGACVAGPVGAASAPATPAGPAWEAFPIAAIGPAPDAAKKNVVSIQLFGTTIPHEAFGKYGAGKILLKPATPGTGVIAGGSARAVLEAAGVQDILTKSKGSSNPHNAVKATMAALMSLEDAASVAARRGVSVTKVLKG